ncbi:MAG: hypothetical protein LBL90_04640 [Prevotellaceae bacterium]|jgi:hypothetical protein|nr:hypothetical protein [Prevotellaceae bacterium]
MKSIFFSAFFIFLFTFTLFSCNDNNDNNDNKDGFGPDLIGLSNKSVNFTNEKNSAIVKTKGDWWWFATISYSGIIIPIGGKKDIIQEDWFSVEKKDKNTILISVEKNNTGNKRNVQITLEAGNYFDYIMVTQNK